jgi:hypothetical protein
MTIVPKARDIKAADAMELIAPEVPAFELPASSANLGEHFTLG